MNSPIDPLDPVLKFKTVAMMQMYDKLDSMILDTNDEDTEIGAFLGEYAADAILRVRELFQAGGWDAAERAATYLDYIRLGLLKSLESPASDLDDMLAGRIVVDLVEFFEEFAAYVRECHRDVKQIAQGGAKS